MDQAAGYAGLRVFGVIDARQSLLGLGFPSRLMTTAPAQIVWGDMNMWTADQQIVWGDQLLNTGSQQIVWGDQVFNPSGQQIVWGEPNAHEWGILAGLALIAGRFPLRVPGSNAWFSISDTFFMTSALLFGPGPATVTIAIDSMLMAHSFRTWQTRRFFFNSGAPAIAFWVGAQVFFGLSGSKPLFGAQAPIDSLVLPVGCFALVYFALNSGLTAVAISLEKKASPLAVWRSHFAVVSLNYFASASVAYLLILLTQYLSIVALVAVVPLLAVINLAMRSWTGRLEDATKHVATVDRLYLSTIEALSTAIEAKDGVTSSHIHRVQHFITQAAVRGAAPTALADAHEAWDRGDYPAALKAYIEIVSGPRGEAAVEEIALQTVTTTPRVAFGRATTLQRTARSEPNPATGRRNPDAMPDGEPVVGVLLASQTPASLASDQIFVVLNWFDEVRQRVPRQ